MRVSDLLTCRQARVVRRAAGFATKAAATVTDKVYFDIKIGDNDAGKRWFHTAGLQSLSAAWPNSCSVTRQYGMALTIVSLIAGS